MKEQTFYIYDHATGDQFSIDSLEMLIEWLNEVDDNLSFSLNGFEDFKKFDQE